MGQTQTLEEIEKQDWGEPSHDSYLVRTIHALRRRPIGDFTVEDLRISIGQQMGIEHLMPLALDHLEVDPFARGDFYRGDLLKVVMEAEPGYWLTHSTVARRMTAVASRAAALLNDLDVTDETKASLRRLLDERPWSAA